MSSRPCARAHTLLAFCAFITYGSLAHAEVGASISIVAGGPTVLGTLGCNQARQDAEDYTRTNTSDALTTQETQALEVNTWKNAQDLCSSLGQLPPREPDWGAALWEPCGGWPQDAGNPICGTMNVSGTNKWCTGVKFFTNCGI